MFGRKPSQAGVASDDAVAVPQPTASDGTGPQGKGRPTPKRRDAEAARKTRQAPPKDKREARRRLRDESKRERSEQLAALRAGDERAYPARDRGPARRIARNYVDGRRSAGEFFWPIVIGSLILIVLPVPRIQAVATFILLGFYVVILSDTALMLTGLNNVLRKAAPDDPMRKGTLPYAFSRSLQNRKRRLPPVKAPRGWARGARKGTVDLSTP